MIPYDYEMYFHCFKYCFIFYLYFTATIIKLDLLSAKQARKQENYEFAEMTLIGLLNASSSSLSEAVPDVHGDTEFTSLTAKLHRESAKMLAWLV